MALIGTDDKRRKVQSLNGYVHVPIRHNLINIAKCTNHSNPLIPIVHEFRLWLIFCHYSVFQHRDNQLAVLARKFLASAEQLKMPPMKEIKHANG